MQASLGITCLEDLGLCQKVSDGSKRKVVHFDKKGKELWKQAQPYLLNPVEERIFCDDLLSNEGCGKNCFTFINKDASQTTFKARALPFLTNLMATSLRHLYLGTKAMKIIDHLSDEAKIQNKI